MFLRIVEIKTAKEVPEKSRDSAQEWSRTSVTYNDYILEDTRFTDDPNIVYACTLIDGVYNILKDTSAPLMPHTFAGWPWKEIPGVPNNTLPPADIEPESDPKL